MKLVANENDPRSYRAKRLPVHVVSETNGKKLITQGIQEGEKIAAAGVFKLYEGLLVRARENRPTSESSLIAVTGVQ